MLKSCVQTDDKVANRQMGRKKKLMAGFMVMAKDGERVGEILFWLFRDQSVMNNAVHGTHICALEEFRRDIGYLSDFFQAIVVITDGSWSCLCPWLERVSVVERSQSGDRAVHRATMHLSKSRKLARAVSHPENAIATLLGFPSSR